MGRGVARTPVTVDPEKEKALRIINAGIALCITGETGSGKEHCARELHSRSQWREGNFVAINCAALPENLIESELFGYAPGAFTGANPKGYSGKFREAHGGVLFLDEIGDMPPGLQTRLLRVLQEKK
jgi:transcriptional regulator with PAS, ATPase and Fis domain